VLERKQLKEAMEGVRIKPPFVWNGKPNIDMFNHWTYEVEMDQTDRIVQYIGSEIIGKLREQDVRKERGTRARES
jgi:hypothetical protein